MLGWLKKDPKAKLEKQYQEKLKVAMEAQRNGDIRGYSELSEQADVLLKQLESLEQPQA